jgi:hypothetical protein
MFECCIVMCTAVVKMKVSVVCVDIAPEKILCFGDCKEYLARHLKL